MNMRTMRDLLLRSGLLLGLPGVIVPAQACVCAKEPPLASPGTPGAASAVPSEVRIAPYKDLVKAAQGNGTKPTKAGAKLECAQRYVAQNELSRAARLHAHKDMPPPGDSGLENFDEIMRQAKKRETELDRLAFNDLLVQARPGELSIAVIRRIDAARETHPSLALTVAEKDLLLWFTVDGEVNNGGLHQYFSNSSGDEAVAALAALRRIGPPEMADIFECALRAFPDSRPSADRKQRNQQLAAYGDTQFEIFNELDDAYYGLKNVNAADEVYVRAHATDFPTAARPLVTRR